MSGLSRPGFSLSCHGSHGSMAAGKREREREPQDLYAAAQQLKTRRDKPKDSRPEKK